MTKRLTTLLLLATIAPAAPILPAAEKIQLFALFKDKAIIKIDSTRRAR
jgi:hypothetical protein